MRTEKRISRKIKNMRKAAMVGDILISFLRIYTFFALQHVSLDYMVALFVQTLTGTVEK